MKLPAFFSSFAVLLTLGFYSAGRAQLPPTPAAPPTTAQSVPAELVVELSPFIVNTTEDKGYRAENKRY